MAPMIMWAIVAQCSCAPVEGPARVVLMTEDQCAAELAPVVRALEGCNRMLDEVSTATTAIAAIPVLPDPDPEPSSDSGIVGVLVGAGLGAGAGAAVSVASAPDGPAPLLAGLGAVGGALIGGAIGALVEWVTR